MTHAAGESSPGSLPHNTHAVVLHARDEVELLDLEAKLTAHGICLSAIREPDEPWNGQLMAIGLEPCLRTKQLRKLMGSFPLAKEQ